MKTRFLKYANIESVLTVLAILVLRLLHFLPYNWRIALGKSIGRRMYKANGKRVKIARKNLQLCFPELSQQEREAINQKVFENFGAGIFETAMSWWTPDKNIYDMTEVHGREYVERALSKGKGLILLGAHFTVLDLSGVLISKEYSAIATYRDQTNAVFNYMILKTRRRVLEELISHKNMIAAVKRIKKGKIVWYAPDQDMGEENSVFAPFFGHPAATLTTTEKLAKLTGAPIVMLSAFRKSDNSGYILRFTPGPENFPAEDDKASAAAINRVIEDAIRYDVTQYAWFHRRFKSQPGRVKGSIYDE